MPKRIENIREMLLDETRRQVENEGYSAVTVRSVAGACGLGIGTVYNYFSSKDMMIATFVLEDWNQCLNHMRAFTSSDCNEQLRSVYICLQRFLEEHETLFRDSGAEKSYASAFFQRHASLREQLAGIILPICQCVQVENQGFLAEFIAESLLTWSVAGKPYAELEPVLGKLLK